MAKKYPVDPELAAHQRNRLYEKRAIAERGAGTQMTAPGARHSRVEPTLGGIARDVNRISDDDIGRALHGDQYGRDIHLPSEMPKRALAGLKKAQRR